MNIYDPDCSCIGCEVIRKTEGKRRWWHGQGQVIADAAKGPQLAVGPSGSMVSPFNPSVCVCPDCRYVDGLGAS